MYIQKRITNISHECSNKWNPGKGQSSKVGNSWLDINIKTTINKTQFKDWGKTTDGEGEFSITTIKGVEIIRAS